MRRALRENATCALFAALGCLGCGWLALTSPVWTDYETEAQPAFEALAHGHLLGFLQLAPVYGGSLIERAPFALLPGLWGGGSLAVYRAVAVPCLLAAALLGIWIVAGMRREGRSRLARAVALGICVANPMTLAALETGHPEELLGGCLCVAAALLACAPEVGTRRALASGLALGLAVANKQWALLALGPVLLALPAPRRKAFLAAMLASAAVSCCRWRWAPVAISPPAPGRRRSRIDDLPTLAAVVVLRPPRRARARAVRGPQAGLPDRAGVGRTAEPSRDPRRRAGARAAAVGALAGTPRPGG